ncbi:hypothetical protein GO495_31695 [Chitinophaga oryziterrae]|uniref:Knr4/Smi1-like domain-containing protein n=1 Tax=Chitinophaga oryziterrae TaxID=1031224 RepID=A0A6N8JIY4_9BACT|nr:SMI1/KNR4 family protein [Chitinophaga oryziterrae]MVT45195.1 hypothetical protein [Chitinophaga oryziterrae]
MLTKGTLNTIQSGSDKEVYTQVTDVALYMATGGFLEAANQLLSELWKYKLPHDRDTWLADTAFMVLWDAAGSYPGFTPFPLDDIESIEKNIRRYIAVDRWAYKMPDKPWNELTDQDLLRKSYITAALVNVDGSFPSSQNELEALSMLEKLAAENVTSCEGFALGAELAARNGKADTGIRLAKIWANGYHKKTLGYLFPLLACSRHVAPVLLQKGIADELNLSETIVQEFLSQAITVLDKRFQDGRTMLYGDLTWKDLLHKISRHSIELEDGEYDESVRISGWIGFDGATVSEITLAENRLGITLPTDYKLFLEITNGIRPFPLNNPALLPVNEIDFIGNILDADTFDSLSDWPVDDDDPETFKDYLSRGIMISRYPDEQMIWLIPTTVGNITSWQTFFFAYWLPGDQRYPGFRYYIEEQLQSIEGYNE